MDIASLQRQLAAQDARLAAAEREIADLKTRVLPVARVAPAPVVEPATVISYPTASVVMPTEGELQSLAAIVLEKFPELRGPAGGRPEPEAKWRWEQEFENALRALGAFGRVDDVDKTRYISFWITEAEIVLRNAGALTDISYSSFMAAVVACSDIPHNYPNMGKQGEVPLLGLGIIGSGRPADPHAYRKVLSTGKLRERVPPPRPVRAGAEPVRISGGNRSVGAG